MFAAENKRRENSNETDSFDDYYLPHLQADGSTVEKKVDRVRYCLCVHADSAYRKSPELPRPYRHRKQGVPLRAVIHALLFSFLSQFISVLPRAEVITCF
jgi:hypothetical protein